MPNEPWIGPTINGNKILFGGRRSRNIYAVVDSRDGVVTAIMAVNPISYRRSLGIATRDTRHLPPGQTCLRKQPSRTSGPGQGFFRVQVIV